MTAVRGAREAAGDRGTDRCLEWLKRCLFVLLVLKFIFYFS